MVLNIRKKKQCPILFFDEVAATSVYFVMLAKRVIDAVQRKGPANREDVRNLVLQWPDEGESLRFPYLFSKGYARLKDIPDVH